MRGMGGRIESAVLGLHAENGGFHVKAATLQGERNYFAAKLNANFPSNPARHSLPTIQGVLGLFDATNGMPLAVMDSMALTLLRTAAATGVAAKYLAVPRASTVTIVGCGAQALPQLAALQVVRPVSKVYAIDRNRDAAERFAERASEALGVPVSPTEDIADARRSEIIVTCTPSRTAFLGARHVSPGAFIAAVGADNEDKSEIEPSLMAAAAVVCDHRGQCEAIGDLHHAIAAGEMRAEDIRAELHEVVVDQSAGRRADDEIIVFDSTGVALEDVAAAAIVYERALAENLGTEIQFER
jgi:ornithine cyclodeaminase/alanine dehydrogenase-like protein (mu-crystallin family)